jgi:hypothetical protein
LQWDWRFAVSGCSLFCYQANHVLTDETSPFHAPSTYMHIHNIPLFYSACFDLKCPLAVTSHQDENGCVRNPQQCVASKWLFF